MRHSENRTDQQKHIGETILEMENITKSFPGVLALDHVNFNLKAGEVHVLLGENGAGKSTLIKTMTGAHIPDEGVIKVNGKQVHITGPTHAQALGIGAVYQEFNLIPELNVGENVFLGKEPMKGKLFPRVDRKTVAKKTKEALDKVGADFDIRSKTSALGVASQQLVEIAKALNANSNILILDEPSAVLTETEIDKLFEVIHKLTEAGVGIVYISHRLEEFNHIADRVTIMRDGRYITTLEVERGKVDKEELIRLMVGRELTDLFPKENIEAGDELLRVENLNREKVIKDINFSLFQGEILGIGGLVGAGRTETAKAIFGADRIDSGKIFVDGKEVTIKSPKDAISHGIGLAPEDRKLEGLIQILEIDNNINMASMDQVSTGQHINMKQLFNVSEALKDKLRIVTPSLRQHVNKLSGGNQQKVVLAKWLATKARIIILDEPTRGIDVGAKVEVYKLMNELVKEGAGIIMISSELPELLAMADRILVMHEGKITGELSSEDATQEKILALAAGQAI